MKILCYYYDLVHITHHAEKKDLFKVVLLINQKKNIRPSRASCSKNRERSVEIVQYIMGHACLADVRAIASITYVLTYPVVYGVRGSRRLDVDCSTGRKADGVGARMNSLHRSYLYYSNTGGVIERIM
jgi:hypothetical protein